jgi:hypothetical protein
MNKNHYCANNHIIAHIMVYLTTFGDILQPAVFPGTSGGLPHSLR